MTRLTSSRLSLAMCLATLAGCASGGGGDENPSVYRENMGQVVLPTLQEAREEIWQKHAIPLYREESSFRSVYWESEWIPRRPTPEEEAAGVTDARNRIILRGRRAGATMDGVPSYSMTHSVENQVRTGEVPDWHPAPIPEEVRNQYRRVYSDLMLEVRAGVRR